MENGLLYYLIIFLAAIFGFFSQLFAKDKKNTMKLNKFFLIISFLLLLLFLAYRKCGVGIDDYNYKRMFDYTIKYGFFKSYSYWGVEPGYMLLNYIISFFSHDVNFMFLINGFISLFFIFKMMIYERKNINFFITIMIFGLIIYPYFFGIMRLSMAFSISFYGFRFFIEKNRKKFNLLILFASCFHFSALLLLLFNLFFNIELTASKLKKIYLSTALFVPIVFLIGKNFLIPFLNSRYSGYLLDDSLQFSLGTFDKVPIIFLFLFFSFLMSKYTERSRIYIFLYSFSLIISISSFIINFGRIEWYFSIYSIILFPMLIRSVFKDKQWRIISIPLVICVFIYGYMFSNRLINPNSKIVNFEKYSNVLLDK